METIYVDILFLINLIMNYFILLATAKISAVPARRLRFCISAALGGLYSVVLVMPVPDFFAFAPMKIVLSMLMLLTAFGGEARLARICITFYAVSAALGGAVFAASMIGGAPVDGRLIAPVSMRTLLLSFAICYAGITIIFQRTGVRAERVLHKINVSLGGETCSFTALLDTGNTLRDPISGFRVIVAEGEILRPLFSREIINILYTRGLSASEEFELIVAADRSGRWRLVPYTAVGIEMGLLLALRADSILIDGKERSDYLVALSPTRLSEDGEFSAVVSF